MPNEDQVKKTIRALLLSSKSGSTPRQLMNDYKYVAGNAIPYVEFGYDSLMSYLSSLKDVVSVSKSRDTTLLRAVPDSSTKHIAKLVSKQRSSDSGLIGGGPRLSSVRPASRSTSSPSYSEVPPTFKAKIKTLMLSYPGGITLGTFQEAFGRRFSYYFSFRNWGFSSLEEMLNSIPEVVCLENDEVRKTVVVKRVKDSSVLTPTADRAKREINWRSLEQERKAIEERKTSFKEGEKGKDIPKKVSQPVDSLHSLESSPPKQNSISVNKASFMAELKTSTKRRPEKRVKSVPWKLIGQVEDLLRANPNGIWVSRFHVEFKSHFGTDLPVSSLGFTSVVHFLSSIPLCAMERPTRFGDWLVYVKGQTKPEVAEGHRFHFQAYVSDELVTRIHRVLKLHPGGIPLGRFSRVYEDVYSDEFPFAEYGFMSVTELLQRVPGIEVVKPPKSTLVMVLQTTPFAEDNPSEEGSKAISKKFTKPLFPTPTSPQPSVYGLQEVSDEPKMSPVYVAHVKTPSCFTIQLIGEKTTKALEYLQEDLSQFYSGSESDKYRIDTPYIGQACCSVFNNDGTWYRAEVCELPEPDVVTVRYVDYGNSSQVPLGAIRHPKAHYLILPAQGIQCRLANLKPAGSTWSHRANQLLYQMTKDKPIVAIKTAFKKRVLSVCLCDTNTSKDIHINDTLVTQGLAIFSPDTEQDHQDIDGYKLEGTPVNRTEDVPNVRLPEDGGKVATVPTSASQASSTPMTTTASGSPTQSPPSPLLQFLPHGVTTQQLQWNYLQQLMMQQLLGQTNPAAAAMLSASGLLTPAGFGLSGQTGFTGLPNMQTGMDLPNMSGQTGLTSTSGQTGMAGQRGSPPSYPPGFGPTPTLGPVQGNMNVAPLAKQTCPTSLASQTGRTQYSLSDASTSDVPTSSVSMTTSLACQVRHSSISNLSDISSTGLSTTEESGYDHKHTLDPSTSTDNDNVFLETQGGADMEAATSLEEDKLIPVKGTRESVSSSAVVSSDPDIELGNPASSCHVTESVQSDVKEAVTTPDLSSIVSTPLTSPRDMLSRKNSLGSVVSVRRKDSTFQKSNEATGKSSDKTSKVLKRVTLTPSHSLSVLRHNDQAHFLSAEVSSWFWDTDLLQSMLRQVQKPIWGRLLWEQQAKQLFWELRSDSSVGKLLNRGQREITLYSLNDLPVIVTTFNGSNALCSAVKREVEKWGSFGLDYFSPGCKSEMERLETEMQYLQSKRKEVLTAMMENHEDKVSTGAHTSLSQLIEVEQAISHLKETLSSLHLSEPPSANVSVSAINGRLDSSNGGRELNSQEASDSGVFLEKNECFKTEDATHDQSPDTSCGGETQNDSSTSQSPPTSSHTQRLSTVSVSTTSTGFESMFSSGSTNNREHTTRSDTQFQFPCTSTAKEESKFNPNEQSDGDSEGECRSWDSWFEDDCKEEDMSVDKSLLSIPLASSDIDLDKKDFFPVEEDIIDSELEEVDALCNIEMLKNKTELCVEVKEQGTVTAEKQSGSDSGPSQTSPGPHSGNNSPLDILDSPSLEENTGGSPSLDSPSLEENTCGSPSLDSPSLEDNTCGSSATSHEDTTNPSSQQRLQLPTPCTKLSECPVSSHCNDTTQSIDVNKSLNSRAHPFSPVQSTYDPSPLKPAAPIPIPLSTPSAPLAPPKVVNSYGAPPNTGIYLRQNNTAISQTLRPSVHPGDGVSIAPPLLMAPSQVLTAPLQIVQYPPQYQPVYYPNNAPYKPVRQGAPLYNQPSQQQVFLPQASYEQFLYDPRLLHRQIQPHIMSGQPQVMNGQQQVMNGQPHVINGQPHLINGQHHVMNGQYHIVNGQYQPMNGQQQARSAGGVGLLGSAPGYATHHVPATPTGQQEGGADEGSRMSLVPTAVLQNLSTFGPSPVLQKRPSAAVPIRDPPEKKPYSLNTIADVDTPPTQRCTASSHTTEMSSLYTSTPSIAPGVAVYGLAPQASPLNQTSTSVATASKLVEISLPVTTPRQNTPKTKLAGVKVRGVTPRVSSPIGLGRGMASERSETSYAKRSVRSIGLGRGLSPGVRRPGGMNTSKT